MKGSATLYSQSCIIGSIFSIHAIIFQCIVWKWKKDEKTFKWSECCHKRGARKFHVKLWKSEIKANLIYKKKKKTEREKKQPGRVHLCVHFGILNFYLRYDEWNWKELHRKNYWRKLLRKMGNKKRNMKREKLQILVCNFTSHQDFDKFSLLQASCVVNLNGISRECTFCTDAHLQRTNERTNGWKFNVKCCVYGDMLSSQGAVIKRYSDSMFHAGMAKWFDSSDDIHQIFHRC